MNLNKIRKRSKDEKIKNKIKSINKLLEHLEISLDDLLKKYEQSYFRGTTISKQQVFRQVMESSLTQESIDFFNKANDATSSHQNDKRDGEWYCSDLILGWLAEDAILVSILNKGIPAKLNGADSNREFLNQDEIDTTPDIIIGEGEKSRLLEVFCDWTDFWNLSNQADLRDNKFNRLVREKVLLLGVAPKSDQGFLINVADQNHGFVFNQNLGNYGGKKGYTSREIKSHLKSLKSVLNELFAIFI